MTEHEPEWMRDARLKGEEARMVQLEKNVERIATNMDAIREANDEERRLRRKAEEALLKHEADDSSKFASIDSRLQGFQNQMSSVSDTLVRIEGAVKTKSDDHEQRLGALEDSAAGASAVARFIRSAWVQFVAGAGLMAALVSVYTALS